jgi:hypothetical protein
MYVHGIKVKTHYVKELTIVLKEKIDPGVDIPFQMKYLNRETYNKSLTYIATKQNSTWNIKIKSMSDCSFFKLEYRI